MKLRKLSCCLACSILFTFVFILSECTSQQNPIQKVENYYQKHTKELTQKVNHLLFSVQNNRQADSIQHAFKEARIAYKKIEFLLDYYNEYTAKSINGAPVEEIEIEDDNVIEPEGFQVIEEFIFPKIDTNQYTKLLEQVKILRSNMNRVEMVVKNTTFSDSHVFDALRLSLFRMITLGITGYDAPTAKTGVEESIVVIQTLKEILDFYQSKPNQSYESLIKQSTRYLQLNQDFDSFDRLTFISKYANKLTSGLLDLQSSLKIPIFNENRALHTNAKTLFDKDAFNPDFYSFSQKEKSTKAKIALGEKLFYEPLLSGIGTVSCATCHQPRKAFAESLRYPRTLKIPDTILRNTPTLLNAAFQSAYFYDGKMPYLEEQAEVVIKNPIEMHGNFAVFIPKIAKIATYQQLFKAAYPEKKTIEPYDIKNALAAYIRTLISMNSRFDKFMRGDSTQLSPMEKKGFNLFAGKAQCAACHFIPLFNGMVPPHFTKMEIEVLGVPENKLQPKRGAGKDLGKYLLFPKFEQFKYAFKTTTVRNAALTAPYMHNGVYETLDEVVEFYNNGGGAGIGINLPYQTLSTDSLQLSNNEKAAIVAFMKSLNDNPYVSHQK